VTTNRDTAMRFARAVIKGAQFARSNEAATREINVAYTGLNPELKDKVLLPELGTTVNVSGMTRTMELMQKYGMLKQPIDISGRVLKLP
jgi:NitT/TauT family transport system substrate-binding protein